LNCLSDETVPNQVYSVEFSLLNISLDGLGTMKKILIFYSSARLFEHPISHHHFLHYFQR
jgi:hypothetical protein